MTISVISTSIMASSSVLTAPFDKTISIDAGTADDRAVVCFLYSDRSVADPSFSATYGGEALTAGPLSSAGDWARGIQTLYLTGASVPTGSNDLVVSSTSSCALYVNAITLSGVDSLRGGTIDTASGNSSSLSDTIVSESGDLTLWWIRASLVSSSYQISGTAPTTMVAYAGAQRAVLKQDATGTSTTMQASHNYGSPRPWGAQIMSFIPAAGGAGFPKQNRMLLGIG